MKPTKIHNVYKPSNDKEAWIGILYACIASDCVISKSELDVLSGMLASKRIFNETDIQPLYNRVLEAIKKDGVNGLVDVCSPLIKTEDRPTLFSMAVEMVLSDGLLEVQERKIIEYLAETLKIDKTLVIRIIEVMLIRNKGNNIRD